MLDEQTAEYLDLLGTSQLLFDQFHQLVGEQCLEATDLSALANQARLALETAMEQIAALERVEVELYELTLALSENLAELPNSDELEGDARWPAIRGAEILNRLVLCLAVICARRSCELHRDQSP